ncbi:hypothetical protein F4779DRAFT_165828 [Xylariaceae sp. FL0662B]|nr:hypothetical protein F4779DRAFT_165828 [Xylariaceae sp. FL0662B]
MMRALLLLACSAFASATTYTLTVFAPGTTIDGAELNAAGQAFYTGTSGPATYCPNDASACPQVQGTLVYADLSGMAVQVPGGQTIFVAPHGHVQYTQPYSSIMPGGAFVGGWFNKTVISECAPQRVVLDFLSTDGSNAGGIKLCPDVADFMEGTGASYTLYAGTASFNASNCIDAVGLALKGSAADMGCWQYL